MPPGPQAGGGGGQSDNSMGIIWGIVAAFAAMGVLWFTFKSQIIYFYLSIKLYEVHLMNALTNDKFASLQATIVTAMKYTDSLKFPDLVLIGDGIGDVLKWPLMALMLVLALVVYFGSSTRIFKRSYGMKDFAKLEVENWPQITPVIGLDLVKVDIHKGPWAMALTPMQFCKRYHLLQEVTVPRTEGARKAPRGSVDVVLRRGEANRIFGMQLGALWHGPERLPPHARALFAVFAARINSDTKRATDVLMRLNLSCKSSKLDMKDVNELLKKHADTKLVKQRIESHAYVLTVMAAMLEGAREDGVQASADFLWLKTRDRRLWYTLNTVGRQTPFVEVAGMFAHWKAEQEAGRKLLVPVVEEATNALELALKEVIYKPDEE